MRILSYSALAICAVTSLALAQSSGSTGSMSSQPGAMTSHSDSMSSMHAGTANASMHTMPATVTSVDAKTGMVEATSEGKELKLHFPPSSLAKVKAGDKITLHLGFTKS